MRRNARRQLEAAKIKLGMAEKGFLFQEEALAAGMKDEDFLAEVDAKIAAVGVAEQAFAATQQQQAKVAQQAALVPMPMGANDAEDTQEPNSTAVGQESNSTGSLYPFGKSAFLRRADANVSQEFSSAAASENSTAVSQESSSTAAGEKSDEQERDDEKAALLLMDM